MSLEGRPIQSSRSLVVSQKGLHLVIKNTSNAEPQLSRTGEGQRCFWAPKPHGLM